MAILVVLTGTAFYRVLSHDFVSFDDHWYIHDNRAVRAGLTRAGAVLAFTRSYASNWHPLTWLSHMLDVELFGLAPAGHHATSLLLHAANTALLYLALRSLTGRAGPSAFAAALFSVHPLHVESVAWVAERKDVLCGFFWMLTMLAYARYVRAPGWRRYGWVVVSCALCLMSKPMGVTLPLALFLLDVWPLGRIRIAMRMGGEPVPNAASAPSAARVLGEKAPLLALAALCGLITWVAQSKGGAVAHESLLPFDSRVANAVLSYWRYLDKTLWPADLAVFYPHGSPSLADGKVLLGAAALLAVTWTAWRLRGRPYLLVGWTWYLVTLLPVIGLVQVGDQAMADRYTYLPLVGPFAALAWGASEAGRRWVRVGHLLPWAAAAAVSALSVATWRQSAHWKDTAALFAHALEVTEDNWLAHNDYGAALLAQGRPDEAVPHLREALRIRPTYLMALANLGSALGELGRLPEAENTFRAALAIDPDCGMAHHGLGILLESQGRHEEAAAHYTAALRQQGHDARLRYQLGAVLNRLSRFDEARHHLEAAVARMPDSADARNALGVAMAGLGRTAEAVLQFQEALRLQPDSEEARLYLEAILPGPGGQPAPEAR